MRGAFTLPTIAPATSAAGKNSQPFSQAASAFNSSSNAAVNQTFRWQAEPAGNNTATPSATLNLLFGSGATNPAETGLKIGANGQIIFASNQTFPGTGTISGVSVGPGLIGGGTNGNISVSLTGSCGLGQVLQWTSVTWTCASMLGGVTPGTDLTGSTTNGIATLNLDTAKVPQLSTANTFTGNQTVNGNVSATGVVTGNSFQIGSNLFGFGSFANANAFLGFGGSLISTGTSNTATGVQALSQNTTGSQNTAIGASSLPSNTTGSTNTAVGTGALNLNSTGASNTSTGAVALQANTTGSFNTANGVDALFNNTTGGLNTALGYLSGPDSAHPSLSNATALGALATVTASNSLVLGSIAGVNGAGTNTNVGIGTTAPAFTLDVRGTGNFTGPVTFASTQTFPNTISGVTAGTGLTGGGTSGAPTLSLDSTKVPLLNAPNTFSGNQGVIGNLTATGNVTATGSVNGATAVFTGSGPAVIRVNQLSTAFASNGITALTSAASGVGVYGQSDDSNGVGVEGLNNSATGGFGVLGAVNNTSGVGVGVWGKASGAANSIGLEGDAFSATGMGLYATNTAVGGLAAKFQGAVQVTGDFGVTGNTTGTVVNASSGFSLGGTSFASGSTTLNNAFLGFSGNTSTTGSYNVGTGSQSLFRLANGSANTAMGYAALYANVSSYYNTAFGHSALQATTGGNNTAVGGLAMATNITGTYNSAFGYLAETDSSTTGLTNATAIGAFADVSSSNSLVLGSINGVNSATADTLVGVGITAPTYKLHVGVFNNGSLRVEGPSASGTGSLAGSFGGFGDFGIDAPGVVNGRLVVKESGAVGIGVALPTHIFQVAQGKGAAFADSWSTYSSRRWKRNIQTLPDALAKVEQLRGVSYDLKGTGKHEIGVIAEEVGAVVPEVVSFEANGKDAQGVDYSRLTAVLIEAVKQQQRQIEKQQRQIARLTAKVGVLETSLRTTKSATRPKLAATNKFPKP